MRAFIFLAVFAVHCCDGLSVPDCPGLKLALDKCYAPSLSRSLVSAICELKLPSIAVIGDKLSSAPLPLVLGNALDLKSQDILTVDLEDYKTTDAVKTTINSHIDNGVFKLIVVDLQKVNIADNTVSHNPDDIASYSSVSLPLLGAFMDYQATNVLVIFQYEVGNSEKPSWSADAGNKEGKDFLTRQLKEVQSASGGDESKITIPAFVGRIDRVIVLNDAANESVPEECFKPLPEDVFALLLGILLHVIHTVNSHPAIANGPVVEIPNYGPVSLLPIAVAVLVGFVTLFLSYCLCTSGSREGSDTGPSPSPIKISSGVSLVSQDYGATSEASPASRPLRVRPSPVQQKPSTPPQTVTQPRQGKDSNKKNDGPIFCGTIGKDGKACGNRVTKEGAACWRHNK